jgi:hypothetical protein
MYKSVYIDRSLQAGRLFNQTLADALCRSLCMIVIYTPHYFDQVHTYCAREYRAMEMLEQKRLSKLAAQQQFGGLIIPIVLRGAQFLPAAISGRRQIVSFESFALWSEKIAYSPEFGPSVRKIAELIVAYNEILAPWSDEFTCECDGFKFPTEEEVKPWLQTMRCPARDFPFRSGA